MTHNFMTDELLFSIFTLSKKTRRAHLMTQLSTLVETQRFEHSRFSKKKTKKQKHKLISSSFRQMLLGFYSVPTAIATKVLCPNHEWGGFTQMNP